jgi:hypothetical protein
MDYGQSDSLAGQAESPCRSRPLKDQLPVVGRERVVKNGVGIMVILIVVKIDENNFNFPNNSAITGFHDLDILNTHLEHRADVHLNIEGVSEWHKHLKYNHMGRVVGQPKYRLDKMTRGW